MPLEHHQMSLAHHQMQKVFLQIMKIRKIKKKIKMMENLKVVLLITSKGKLYSSNLRWIKRLRK